MARIDIVQKLRGKWTDETRPRALFDRLVSKAPGRYVEVIVEGLGSEERRCQSELLPRVRGFLEPYLASEIRSVAAKAGRVMRTVARSRGPA